jgi:hypothetical protein
MPQFRNDSGIGRGDEEDEERRRAEQDRREQG